MLVKILLLIACIQLSLAAYEPCKGKARPDLQAIPAQMTLLEKSQWGDKWVAEGNGQKIYLLNLTGNAYQMGYSYGQLMGREIKQLAAKFFDYVDKTILPSKRIPRWLRNIEDAGVKGILRLNYRITRNYTPKRFQDQMRGLAAGSGLPIDLFREVNMIAELTKAACSIVGAWGKATDDGRLIHLRALDWDAFAPLWDYSLITVYHSTEMGASAIANVGWAGFVGSITSFGKSVSVGEKYRHQKSNKNTTRFGKPWNYVLRDMAMFGKDIHHAVEIGNNSDRTCSVWFGVSSMYPEPSFRLIEYSQKQYIVYDDKNYPANSTHPRMDNLLYMEYGDDRSTCFKDLFEANYGKITPQFIYQQLAPSHLTGDTQLAIFDYSTYELTIGFSRDGANGEAYNHAPIIIKLGDYL